MWLVWPLAGLAVLIITALAVLARRRRQATTNAALKRAGIGWGHVAAVELNDAFAAQSVACIKAWGIDSEIVNAHGGAICHGSSTGRVGYPHSRYLGAPCRRAPSGRAQ